MQPTRDTEVVFLPSTQHYRKLPTNSLSTLAWRCFYASYNSFQLTCVGPIVRIGPNELHILDPSYYNTLYSNRNRLDKSAWFYGMLGNPEATFPTINAGVHKVRRAALAPFFSTYSVSIFSPRVQSYTDRLCERMKICSEKNEPIPLFYALRCLTVDIIAEYVFGHDLQMLDRADWGRDFYSAWRALWELSPLIRQLPLLMTIFDAMPRWALALVQPRALEVIDMQIATDKLTKEALESDQHEEKMSLKMWDHPTVLWEIATNSNLPASERTFRRLACEANNILAAGFETTGGTLSHLIYLVIANRNVHERLFAELEVAIPERSQIPGYQTLEKLPYLSAVIKESLRYVNWMMSLEERTDHQQNVCRRLLSVIARQQARRYALQRLGDSSRDRGRHVGIVRALR